MASCYAAARRKDWNAVRKCVCPLLAFYLCVVFSITIVNRMPYDEARYSLFLFWSYRAAAEKSYLIPEILLNYLMLLPYGLMAPLYMKRRYVILSSILLSAGIETAQLCLRRGLFEFDDILGNTVGVLLGTLIYTAIRKRVSGSDERVS